ncbi:MAG: L-erythro-3,5-diaminohexanoate dehydrogenase [Humibacillus sp.]|nr:L-erythro-3,5-diaminohexanoate dehydrogenase [Humibacillus sp.]MDN5779919.1 L-erythro-3,5-diaminohexanoate dehydrogenase [Humibacillus sp.]
MSHPADPALSTAQHPRMSSPVGLHRVLDPPGADGDAVPLPQAAQRLDARSELWPDEVRIAVETLNLDAASFRQLSEKHHFDGAAVRDEVLEIVATRGKMQNPVTGSGGMLIGTVEAVGPESRLGLSVGDRVATLVSLSLTPLVITDGLTRWDGRGEQVPARGHAILFGRSIAARLPDDLDPRLSLMVMDVCGAPALVERVVGERAARVASPTVLVLGGAGKSGSLSLAAARRAGAGRVIAIVPVEREVALLKPTGLADAVVLADARSPLGLSAAVEAAGGPADVTVVCVDAPGCEQPAILATAQGGTIIFFSMATSFSAAALGAEGLAADVRMIVGNGYAPGHADLALSLLREVPGVRSLFEARLAHERSAADPPPQHTENPSTEAGGARGALRSPGVLSAEGGGAGPAAGGSDT